jgi:hypothetical protein
LFEVIKTLNGDKAPSPDGFSLGFFQTYREVLKKDSMVVFKEFHGKGRFEKSIMLRSFLLSQRELVLWILKIFHPINLVDGVYKIISKVLVNRLKRVLEKIISNFQNVFISL